LIGKKQQRVKMVEAGIRNKHYLVLVML